MLNTLQIEILQEFGMNLDSVKTASVKFLTNKEKSRRHDVFVKEKNVLKRHKYFAIEFSDVLDVILQKYEGFDVRKVCKYSKNGVYALEMNNGNVRVAIISSDMN